MEPQQAAASAPPSGDVQTPGVTIEEVAGDGEVTKEEYQQQLRAWRMNKAAKFLEGGAAELDVAVYCTKHGLSFRDVLKHTVIEMTHPVNPESSLIDNLAPSESSGEEDL